MNPAHEKSIKSVASFIAKLGPNIQVRERFEQKELMIRVVSAAHGKMYDHYVTYDAIIADERGVIRKIAQWFDDIAKKTGKSPVEPGIYDLTAFMKETAPVVEPKKQLGKWELHDDAR